MYKILFNFYNFFSTKYENFFFKKFYKKNKNSDYLKNGYQILKIKKKIALNCRSKKKISVNKYMKKYILNKTEINQIVSVLFFENKLKKIIEENLKFNFDINFIIAYQTLPLHKKDTKIGWYANHWHKDKTFSKNILKLIVPLENINKNSGGTQVYNKTVSKKIISDIKTKPFVFTGSTNDVLLLNPNLCYHKAGNPKFKSRSQIMIQLNPSKNWSIDKDLFDKQFQIEPKFPLITNIFNKKQKLKWKKYF